MTEISRKEAKFFSKLPTPEARENLRYTFDTYRDMRALILSDHNEPTYLVEVGPGARSVAALALANRHPDKVIRYIGLERDAGRAQDLRLFLRTYHLRGSVRLLSIFDLDFRLALPFGVWVFCFDHSLEDLILADLAESIGIYDLCWTNVIASLEVAAAASKLVVNVGEFAKTALNRVFAAIEELSREHQQTMCLVHHYRSPQYQASSLRVLDAVVTERSWNALTTHYETLFSVKLESKLPHEFWWFGRLTSAAIPS